MGISSLKTLLSSESAAANQVPEVTPLQENSPSKMTGALHTWDWPALDFNPKDYFMRLNKNYVDHIDEI